MTVNVEGPIEGLEPQQPLESATEEPRSKRPYTKKQKPDWDAAKREMVSETKTHFPTPQAEPETTRKDLGEDFFDYLARVPGDVWSSGGVYLYIYKVAAKGNVRLERIDRPITYDELLKEVFPRYGEGTYYIQFTSRFKSISSCSQRLTFDGSALSLLEDGQAAKQLQQTEQNSSLANAAGEAVKVMADAANKSNEILKRNIEKGQTDPIATIKAVMDFMPKNDNSIIIQLLNNQMAEANARAERDLKAAEERSQRETKAAEERAKRDQEFFNMIRVEQEARSKDKELFFQTILAEKDKKNDNLGAISNIIGSVMAIKEKLDEAVGGGDPVATGWAGVIQALLPRVLDTVGQLAPVLGARFGAGVMPPPSAPYPAPVNQNPQLISGIPSNGKDSASPSSSGVPFMSREQQLLDMVNRLGMYLSSRDTQFWEPEYFFQVLEVEYPELLAVFNSQSKDIFVSSIKGSPVGIQIMNQEIGMKFVEAIFELIQNPPKDDDIPEVPEATIVDNPTKRRRVEKPM